MPDSEPKGTILIGAAQKHERGALKASLEPQGYRVFFAVSGAQVLADADSLNPDVIVLESDLSDMSGVELCRELKSNGILSQVPVLLLSDPENLEARAAIYQAGVTQVLFKPIDPLELQTHVSDYTQLRRFRQERARRAHTEVEAGPATTTTGDLSVLDRVIQALSAKQNPEELLHSLCEVLGLIFDVPYTAAWTLNESQDFFEVEAEYGAPPQHPARSRLLHRQTDSGRLVPPGEALPVEQAAWLHTMLEEQQVLALGAVLGETELTVIQDPARKGHVASVLVVPIVFRGEVSGFIELNYFRARTFSEQELDLARSVSSAVSEAVDTARLYERLQNYADFLDQALAQRTLELKGERYRTESILETLGEAVVITDMDSKIQYVNQAAVELTGYTREELLGKRMRLWRSHRQTAELYTQMLDALHNGLTWRGEVINERKDGTLYNAALTVAPYYDPNDHENPIGFVSVQRDITPVKEAERLKDQFVSNVSHELRTPLSIITLLVGNLDTLYERMEDDKRRKLIRDIRGHTQVLNDLIISVLDLSRIDGGRVPRDYEDLDLAHLLKEETEKQGPLAKNKYQRLHFQESGPLIVRGNPPQLRQMIRNLVNNAIKYTPEGGYISCECQVQEGGTTGLSGWPGSADLPEGEWAAFRVCDTGVGIHQEDLPHLFERFYRVKSQGDIPGAGLGLSIAKELVHLHSGHIAVDSTPGEGSIFAVYLPLVRERE